MGSGEAVKVNSATIVSFIDGSISGDRQVQRTNLLRTLRSSASPVIVDLSGCGTLDHQDIGMLLDGLAELTGRDTKALLVAGSRSNRVLLEVTRISSLVPVFDSLVEALTYSQVPAQNDREGFTLAISQTGSA